MQIHVYVSGDTTTPDNSVVAFVPDAPTILLPAQLYRVQLDAMRRDGKIPFGVPIALAAIAALLIPIGALPVHRAAPDISDLTLSGFE